MNISSVKVSDLLLVSFLFFSISPFFKLLPGGSEIQPIGALFSVLYIMIFSRKLTRACFVFYFSCVVWFCLSTIFLSTAQFSVSVETFLAIISPVLVLSLFYNLHSEKLSIVIAVFLISFSIWMCIGVLQGVWPGFLKATKIDDILSSLISRYSSTDISGSGRGIRLLASEPSYAAHVIALMFSSLLLFKKHGLIDVRLFYLYVSMIFIVAFFNRSATLFAFFTLFLFSFVFLCLYKLKTFIYGFFALLLAMAVFTFLTELSGDDLPRAIEVYKEVVAGVFNGSILDILFKASGQRTASVYVGFWTLLNLDSGYFFGSWSQNFQSSLVSSGVSLHGIYYFENVTSYVKPYSWVSTLSYDLGFLGFILGVMVVLYYIKKLISLGNAVGKLEMSIVSVCFFMLFFNTPVALPSYWVLLGVVFYIPRCKHIS